MLQRELRPIQHRVLAQERVTVHGYDWMNQHRILAPGQTTILGYCWMNQHRVLAHGCVTVLDYGWMNQGGPCLGFMTIPSYD